VFFCKIFYSYFGELNILKKSHPFYTSNTFFRSNWLPDPKFWFRELCFIWWVAIAFHNKVWWRLWILLFKSFLFWFIVPHDLCRDNKKSFCISCIIINNYKNILISTKQNFFILEGSNKFICKSFKGFGRKIRRISNSYFLGKILNSLIFRNSITLIKF